MEQKQKPIRALMQKAKSFFSRKAKTEGARRLSEEEQKKLDEQLFNQIWAHEKTVTETGAQIDTHAFARYLQRLRIKRLLKAGANLEAKDRSSNMTPLMHAADKGHTDICRILLTRGANLEAKDGSERNTALMLAVRSDHYETVKYLLSRGADINARNNEGKTPWILAGSGTWIKRLKIARLMKKALLNRFEKEIGKESFALFMASFKECTGQ